MKKSDFFYSFRPEQVATEPASPPSSANLMIYDREDQRSKQVRFIDLLEHLRGDELFVFNKTRVIPARFFLHKEGAKETEGLYLEGDDKSVRVWLKGKWKEGDEAILRSGPKIPVLFRQGKDAKLSISQKDFVSYLETNGEMPLPPYLRSERLRQGTAEAKKEDKRLYQNPFAKDESLISSAAPTASLHCDESFMKGFREKQVDSVEIELEIGLGTFAPMEVENIEEHKMHREIYRVSKEADQKIRDAKKAGRPVVAVGTTVLRCLESYARLESPSDSIQSTDLFVRPGFQFLWVDQLITNFHQPESTLLMLVATFLEPASGQEVSAWRTIYKKAVDADFRLFSYGDAMWIR